ncbi:glycine decarboxylase subunit H [Martiniozyma asiatica (nom. inval.)]|nr:glycine decarboxylase subunit H [Martiniozyma asiatica]
MFARAVRFNPLKLSQIRFSSYKLTTSAIPFTHSSSPIVKFTKEHEWVAIHSDGTSFIGITSHAADALGDVTFVELPEELGEIAQGETVGSIESVKSASDVYSPIQGELVEVNSNLDEDPALINSDPMGEGWIVKVKLEGEGSDLMSEEEYVNFLKEEEH